MKRDRVISAVIGAVLGALVGAYIGSRYEVVTYTSFRIEPTKIPNGVANATLYMSVAWNKPGCEVAVKQTVWSVDRTKKYSDDELYTARMRDERRFLLDKPRPIKLPALTPGDYLIGFDPIWGSCWPWEKGWLALQNTPPTPAPFTVTP